MGEGHMLSVAPPGLWWMGCGLLWRGYGVSWRGAESHGSGRGLIADAPTGAGEPHYRSVALNSEASDDPGSAQATWRKLCEQLKT
jgi:hypothetical protein